MAAAPLRTAFDAVLAIGARAVVAVLKAIYWVLKRLPTQNKIVLVSRLYATPRPTSPGSRPRSPQQDPKTSGRGAEPPQHEPAPRPVPDARRDVPPRHRAGLHHRQLHRRDQRAAAQGQPDRHPDLARARGDQALRARRARLGRGAAAAVRAQHADAPRLRLGDRRRPAHGGAVRRVLRRPARAGAADRHTARRPALRPGRDRAPPRPHPGRPSGRGQAPARPLRADVPQGRTGRGGAVARRARHRPTSTSSWRCTRSTTATSRRAPASSRTPTSRRRSGWPSPTSSSPTTRPLVFDAAVAEVPLYFYLYDLDDYRERRGLFLDVEHDLPGPVERDAEALVKAIVDGVGSREEVSRFRAKFIAPSDGGCARRIVQLALGAQPAGFEVSSRVVTLGIAVLKRLPRLRARYRTVATWARHLRSRWRTRGGIDHDLIVFECFVGRSYAGSPRALYEAMLADPRYESAAVRLGVPRRRPTRTASRHSPTRARRSCAGAPASTTRRSPGPGSGSATRSSPPSCGRARNSCTCRPGTARP